MFKLHILIDQHSCLRQAVELRALCAMRIAKLMLVGFVFLSVSMPALANTELRILTWSEYIDPEVVEEFESLYIAQIRFSYFESDQARDEAVASVDAHGYNLFLIDSLKVERYATRGWLESLDRHQIPNTKYINSIGAELFRDLH